MADSERKNCLTRREFLYLGLAAAGVAASRKIRELIDGNFEPIGNLERLAEFRVIPPEFSLPPKLRGISMNSPFLWQNALTPEVFNRAITNARTFGAGAIRIFINDAFESKLGDYNFGVLEKIKSLAEKFPLMVDLFDAYSLLHSSKPNLVYGSSSLTSPYLLKSQGRSVADQQQAFFIDPGLREGFLTRAGKIINSLSSSNIIAWSVANELVPPLGTLEQKREILTVWYEAVLPEIKRLDKDRPIISGIADPTFIDEERLKKVGLAANTLHLYPDSQVNLAGILSQRQQCLPLMIQEIGFPERVCGVGFGALRDRLMADFFTQQLLNFMKIDEENKIVRLGTETLGIWRLGFAGDWHDDGYQVDPRFLPRTVKVLQTWRSMIEKLAK